MEQQRLKYDGKKVFMNGQDWIVPALGVRDFKTHSASLTRDLQSIKTDEFVSVLEEYLPIIHLALARNYPDVTVDQLWDMVDLATFPVIVKAIAAASGIEEAKPGE